MITADTSVVVAAFASWHQGHGAARRALAGSARLPAHVAVEAYSVLTRLPPPHRAAPGIVDEFLAGRFPEPFLTLQARAHRALLGRARQAGFTGGAIFDALVAATARHAGAKLLTRDRRALPVYQSMGVDYDLVV